MIRKRQHKNIYNSPYIDSIKACFSDIEPVYEYKDKKETN